MAAELTDTERVVVLSGPSGSGKTTIVSRLVCAGPVRLRKCVSATTRRPRKDEVDGNAYYFLTHDEFQRRRKAGEFVECAEVFASGHWYGTLYSEIEKASRDGVWAVLEIDVQGTLCAMQTYPDAVTIFLRTPEQEYERRLRSRGTETEDVIRRRIQTAREELKTADQYRFQVVNDDLGRAVAEISQILLAEEQQSHA